MLGCIGGGGGGGGGGQCRPAPSQKRRVESTLLIGGRIIADYPIIGQNLWRHNYMYAVMLR